MTRLQDPLWVRATVKRGRQRVLVTGGAGFIGSHVVDALLREGTPVTVLDDLSTGDLANLPDDPSLRFVHGDAADLASILDAMAGCSRVVHMAAIASVQRSVEDPIGTRRANYEATLRLLDAAHRHGVDRFVYASSAAVYGDVQSPPVDEAGPTDPRSPYALDKLMGERALDAFRREHALAGVSLRFFNVYGPRQRSDSAYSGVISQFVRRALDGEPITVFGDGTQTRDFVFVGDVAKVVTELTQRRAPPEASVMNVGRAQPTSVLGLVEAIETTLGTRLERRTEEARTGDVRHSFALLARLQHELGWTPRVSLEEGLRVCIEEASPRATPDRGGTSAPRPRATGG